MWIFFPDIFWEMIVLLRKDGFYLSDYAYILLWLSKPQTLFTTNVTAYLMIKYSQFVIFIILFFCMMYFSNLHNLIKRGNPLSD